MNNLKYYQDGLAYDFSLFAPAEDVERKAKRNNVTPIPEIQRRRSKIRKEAAFRVSGKVSAILVTVFIIIQPIHFEGYYFLLEYI